MFFNMLKTTVLALFLETVNLSHHSFPCCTLVAENTFISVNVLCYKSFMGSAPACLPFLLQVYTPPLCVFACLYGCLYVSLRVCMCAPSTVLAKVGALQTLTI